MVPKSGYARIYACAGLIERDEKVALIMTDLLENICFANAEAKQIKPLMHLICSHYYDDDGDDANAPTDSHQDSTEYLYYLCILWHRMETLKITMNDSGLNKLYACHLIRNLIRTGDTYRLNIDKEVEHHDLTLLVAVYEAGRNLSMKKINTLLEKKLVIENPESHSQASTSLNGTNKKPLAEQQQEEDIKGKSPARTGSFFVTSHPLSSVDKLRDVGNEVSKCLSRPRESHP